MRTWHLSTATLAVGIFGIAMGACDSPTNDGSGSGGTQSASGGTAGTSSSSGGSASGGTSGSGGVTVTGGTTSSGGTTASGGSKGTGGAPGTGGAGTGGRGDGGRTVPGTGGKVGGAVGTGGENPGGATGEGGATAAGGRTAIGGRGAGGTTGGGGRTGTAGAPGTGGRTTPTTGTGTCTASKATGKSISGSGPHKVVMEMNSDAGIKCGTIYRPEDLGGDEKYPIFVWGEGGCSQSGTSNQAAMGEIASYGFFIVADGVASGTACSGGQDGKAFLDYITWAIAENDKPCSAYYQSLDTTKIAADGFSCGGLMSENVSGDPRFTAIGITSSGLQSPNSTLYGKIHTPFKIMNGGSGDMAYENGLRDYDEISKRGIPIIYFSQSSAGHGGDLSNAKGTFNSVNLAWLKWQLKGDEGATGKGYLIGSSCKYCNTSGWDFKSANIQ
jgi:hypothetical protein